MTIAPKIKNEITCSVCGATFTSEEFDRLMPCTSPTCPDGTSIHEGQLFIFRLCNTCLNGLCVARPRQSPSPHSNESKAKTSRENWDYR